MKAESGVNVRFWHHMLVAAANASNVTYKKRIDTTPFRAAFGEKKDLSKIRTFGCKAVMYLEPVRRDGLGRFAYRGVEGINLGQAIDQKFRTPVPTRSTSSRNGPSGLPTKSPLMRNTSR